MIPHARVLIEKENKILLIHRINKGREYYIIPGGHVEKNEDIISAAIRDIVPDIQKEKLILYYDQIKNKI